MANEKETVLKGGRTNYYLVKIDHPQREDQPPYRAECEDLIEGLKLTFNEANVFKEIWRSANARLDNGKPDHNAAYGAEKILHYAQRIKRVNDLLTSSKVEVNLEEDGFIAWLPDRDSGVCSLPVGVDHNTLVDVKLSNGCIRTHRFANSFNWWAIGNHVYVVAWRFSE